MKFIILIALSLSVTAGAAAREHYQAKFVTLNPDVNGKIPGAANFYFIGTQVIAHVRFFAGGVKTIHRQTVYEGGRCPTMADDLNKDGFIDSFEAEMVLGKRLIPLDGDISTQKAGGNISPMGDASGTYEYEEFANARRFLRDLKAVDPDLDDDLRKLERGEELNLERRTVLIQGVSPSVKLPDSLTPDPWFIPAAALPVTCGEFRKIE